MKVRYFAAAACVSGAARLLVACASAPPATDPGVYLNRQLDCIAEASTRLQADQCRWGVQVEAGRLHYDVPGNHLSDAGGQ